MKRSPLQRKTPLRAKKPWRRKAWQMESRPAPKRAELKKVSKSRRRTKQAYFAAHAEYLERFPVCGICLARDLTPPNRSTEIHHSRGRIGRLLTDERFFVPSCRACREWPHEHPHRARALGLLAEPADWNVYPRE